MTKKKRRLFARVLAIVLALISVLSIALSFAPSGNEVVYNSNDSEIITESDDHAGHNHEEETQNWVEDSIEDSVEEAF